MAKYFTDLAVWRDLLAGDFNRGYFAGVVLVLAVVLVLLAIRIVLSFIFRNRRVRSIVVPAADGEVMISQKAVIAAVESMLKNFPALMIDSLKIYRRRRQYAFLLHCRFKIDDTAAFPDVAQRMKDAVFAGMQAQFGVTGLRKIRIVLTELDNSKDLPAKENSAAEEIPAVTPGVSADQM